jgi:molybdate-binding protein
VGEVGERLVAVELADHAVAGAGWAMPDGIVEDPGVRLFPGAATAGLVMAGCDPALALAEQALAQAGPGRVLAASASSGEALAALADGWVHAAVVHGPPRALPRPPIDVTRVHLAHWRVGLGLAESVRADSIEALVRHGTTIVQREAGATSQQALVRALAHGGAALAAGPRAAGHIDAARRAVEHGCAAVTIEGAARRFRLRFLPLERHSVEIWIGARFAAHPGVASLRELLASAAFTERLDGFGGYDLSGCGTSVAAA